MSSSIHYKFRTTNVSKTLSFDGPAIRVSELKKAICTAENIKAELFDLVFFNSFNKQPYIGDDEIPKNSSVTVQRVPIENGVKIPKISNPEIAASVNPTPGVSDGITHIKQEDFSKMTEEERIKHITKQSIFKYTTNNYNRKPISNNMQQAPPDYLCNRCNQLGHFPKSCPLLNIRKTTGIPNEELMETTADDPQAMLHPSGKFMIPIMHYKAREQRKLMEEQRKNGSANNPEQKNATIKKELPPELRCPLCNNTFKEALVTSCCGESFCADCIQQVMSDAIAADSESQCPNCQSSIGASSLFPNNSLREAVEKYKKSLNAPFLIQDMGEDDAIVAVKEDETESSSPTKMETVEEPKLELNAAEASPVTEEEKLMVVPTVNLSVMLAAQKPKQKSINTQPKPIIDFSKPPPNIPVVLPTISGVDFTKPPPNFKLPDFSHPPPVIPLHVPASNTNAPPLPQMYRPSPSKPIISESKYNLEDEEAINSAWEKLNVGDDTLDLATLFEARNVTHKDDSNAKSKEKQFNNRSKSHERHRRVRSRSKTPVIKRKESKERESSLKKKEAELKHKDVVKRSFKSHTEKENGRDRGKDGKNCRSDEQKNRTSYDRERRYQQDNEDKKAKSTDLESIEREVKTIENEKLNNNEETEKSLLSEDITQKEGVEKKEEKRNVEQKQDKKRSERGEKDQDIEKNREKKKDKERTLEKKKSNKKERSVTVDREKSKGKKKSSSKEKKKSKLEEKKKKKRRRSSDRSEEKDEKQKRKRHKEKKHKKYLKRERESISDDSGDDRRKRRKT